MMRNGRFLICITCPTGSTLPKSISRTVSPNTATLLAASISCDVNHSPEASDHSKMFGYSMPVPCTAVGQFWLAYITWKPPRNEGVA